MEQDFHKIRRLSPYVFTKVNEMKMLPRGKGEGIIVYGMDNSDHLMALPIVDKLRESVLDPFNLKVHHYSNSPWISGLWNALASYYRGRFGDKSEPERQTIISLSTQEWLANLSSAIAIAGDENLIPDPSYPIHQFTFIIAGAVMRNVLVTPDHGLSVT